ncbi:hypothetical protein PG997_008668 [Apiospora hydei]|uniref:Condensation domain-containing protein n=1 Tax=Apiospora hydei TaxID=1337664 RepID=A0ABR1WBG6_9PEZI
MAHADSLPSNPILHGRSTIEDEGLYAQPNSYERNGATGARRRREAEKALKRVCSHARPVAGSRNAAAKCIHRGWHRLLRTQGTGPLLLPATLGQRRPLKQLVPTCSGQQVAPFSNSVVTELRQPRVEAEPEELPSGHGDEASSSNILRRLGRNESYQIALQNLDQMRGNIVTYRYKLPNWLAGRDARQELFDTMEKAIASVVLKHPLMHVGLVGKDTTSPSWARLEEINLQNHIEWRLVTGGLQDFNEEFRAACSEQLDTKFDNYLTAPGWLVKIIHLDGSGFIEVLLNLNHTNMDGGSAKIFHKDLLQNLHDGQGSDPGLLLNKHILTLTDNSTATLSPPAENFVAFPVEAHHLDSFIQGSTLGADPSRAVQDAIPGHHDSERRACQAGGIMPPPSNDADRPPPRPGHGVPRAPSPSRPGPRPSSP